MLAILVSFINRPTFSTNSNLKALVILDNSIAVLPFDDMSSGGDTQWFCDGVTEDILTNLAKLKGLKVISRTSTERYKNTDKSIPEIAKELGVINFWFMAGGNRIHKTVHHYLFREVGGKLAPQLTEVDDVGWFPLGEIVELLAYPDEKKLIAKSGDLVI